LTAELVTLVDVPVIASGDVTSRGRAQTVLATTGAAAVMVGRGAQGNPWALREIVDGEEAEPSCEEVAAELILFIRETVREPGEGEERVDELDRRRVRGDQVGETTGGDRARVDRELVANAPDDAVHLAGEPVDESRLEARDGRLADDVLRLDEVDFAQTGCPGEQRVHGDLDPRCQNTADVLGLRRHDVEVRRRAEVDDDARGAVAVSGGDRVRNAIGTDLARVFVSDRNAGSHARPELEQLGLRVTRRKLLVRADELRH